MENLTKEQREIAEGIALDTGALTKCETCDNIIEGTGLHAEASALALRQYKAGLHIDVFSKSEDLYDAVYTVINDYPSEDCHCKRALG